MKQFVVKRSITINAPASEVWDALTNPEKTKKYFFHCKVHSDWKVGSPITFKGRIFWIIPIEMKGTIEKIEPGKLLKYTIANASDNSGTKSVVTDELNYAHGETELTITDDVGQGEGAEKRYNRSVKGWDKILNGLKELVEGE
ncbi:MAG: SRPBCC domain-containing protein [Mucilaginibacter sp.]